MKTLEEMNEYKEDFHYYDVINDKEVTVNDVHLTACLFFRDGHLPEVREQLRDCIDQYMALFGEYITWGLTLKIAGGKKSRLTSCLVSMKSCKSVKTLMISLSGLCRQAVISSWRRQYLMNCFV